jgi:uncharacterized membrane protein
VSISRSETGRVEAFSDGVFAIVITVLILGIQVPEARTSDADLWRALRGLVPVIAGWVVSFAFVLVFWVAHHYLFAQLAHVNRGLLWLNGLLLLCSAFTPFPTALQVGPLARGREFEPDTPPYNTGMSGRDLRRAFESGDQPAG